jgi:hypothetical protein
MQRHPDLFGTKARTDCFIVLAMLTADATTVPTLSSLYRSLPYAENSVRNYLRSLAIGGWVSFVREAGTDRRSIGLRLEPPIIRVFEEYFAMLGAIGSGTYSPIGAPGDPTISDPGAETPAAWPARISA